MITSLTWLLFKRWWLAVYVIRFVVVVFIFSCWISCGLVGNALFLNISHNTQERLIDRCSKPILLVAYRNKKNLKVNENNIKWTRIQQCKSADGSWYKRRGMLTIGDLFWFESVIFGQVSLGCVTKRSVSTYPIN